MDNASSVSVSDDACCAALGGFEDRLRSLDDEITKVRHHLASVQARRDALIEAGRRLHQQVGRGSPQLSAAEAQSQACDRSPRDISEQHIALQCVQTVLGMLDAPPRELPDLIRDAGAIYDFVTVDARPN